MPCALLHRPARSLGRIACGSLLLGALGCSLDTQGVGDDDAFADEASGELDGGSMLEEMPTMRERRDAARTVVAIDATLPRLDGSTTHGDAQANTSTADAGRARSDASVPSACDLSGTYALHTEVEIAWDGWTILGLPILSPGSGTFSMDALSTLRADHTAEVRACDVSIPDFETERSTLAEVYGVTVPSDVWERPSLPTWSTSWITSCDAPGCTLLSGSIQALLGARVTSDPFVWPDSSAPRSGFEVVDDDGDGQPGLTLLARGPNDARSDGRRYSYPPVVSTLFARAQRIMMALGMRAQLDGQIDACDELSGSLSVAGVYARALGCAGTRGAEPFTCEPAQVQFLDRNLPVWQVRSAKFRSRRIDDASCDGVRTTLRALASTP